MLFLRMLCIFEIYCIFCQNIYIKHANFNYSGRWRYNLTLNFKNIVLNQDISRQKGRRFRLEGIFLMWSFGVVDVAEEAGGNGIAWRVVETLR